MPVFPYIIIIINGERGIHAGMDRTNPSKCQIVNSERRDLINFLQGGEGWWQDRDKLKRKKAAVCALHISIDKYLL